MFYAAFPDSIKAQQMVRHLLLDGIAIDDISLVTRDQAGMKDSAEPSTGDASFFVGRTDDPSRRFDERQESEARGQGNPLSPIGGGVSTADRATDVESLDQAENSQSIAEDESSPIDDTSNSKRELDDYERAINSGFDTPMTQADDEAIHDDLGDQPIEAVSVPGVGLIIGGGDMATAAFDWKGKNGDPDPSSFLTYFQDEGVPPTQANEMLEQFGNGGSILAVALVPKVDEDALEDVAERYGAVSTGWYGAPRF